MSTSFSAESPDNYQQKCCCVLVLDVSSSMRGNPIKQLNSGIQEFYSDIKGNTTSSDRLEIAVVEFCDTINTIVPPSLVENFAMPVLESRGTTKLVDGVKEGIRLVQDRKAWYKQTGQPYYRPWVILITDGEPDEDQDIKLLAAEIQQGVSKKDFFFFAVGVVGANMKTLTEISDPGMRPAMLEGLKFDEFFKWLSASMSTITHSKDGDKVDLPDASSWMNGFSVS